jgi:hypothetical protein
MLSNRLVRRCCREAYHSALLTGYSTEGIPSTADRAASVSTCRVSGGRLPGTAVVLLYTHGAKLWLQVSALSLSLSLLWVISIPFSHTSLCPSHTHTHTHTHTLVRKLIFIQKGFNSWLSVPLHLAVLLF